MDINEILKFINKLVAQKTGKYLSHVQKAIIEGTLQRQSYSKISQKCHLSEGYISDIASQLWKLLSAVLDENVNKSNFLSIFERLYSESPESLFICVQSQNNLTKIQSQFPRQDLTLAPKILKFYDRETEIKMLSDWIFNDQISLINVLGLSGIGKTSLVKRFVDLNLNKFDFVVWNNLKICQNFDINITKIITLISQHETIKNLNHQEVCQLLSFQLLNLLHNRKGLIIFDDVQELFIKGDLAGKYQEQYKQYQLLFNLLKTIDHQSHVILISEEQCQTMPNLDQNLCSIRSLQLTRLPDQQILKDFELKNEEKWQKLIDLYEGNLNYLKDIACLINHIFDGNVSDFLLENKLIITKNMEEHLQFLFHKISAIEKQIVLILSKFPEPISIKKLKNNLDLSLNDLINGLESLQYRYLVTKIKEDQIMFNLSPVLREYLKNFD